MATALSIAIPLVALVVLALGEARWSRRPWFLGGGPRRGLLAVILVAFLAVAVVRAVA
jgi:hypothetical protein